MRPMRLDLAGFTVFRDPVTVDFTDADFFALVGPTGSGKSTVLDAICFALYGTVPRWNDRRAVSNALAPSAGEARVRLVFESAGMRYAATRVVRRDGKGRVTTSHAGMELLPAGFDPSTLDGEQTELGEPLAGTPAEMEQAVLDAIGLPYEQFTSCVMLPQGQFAEFLHAKPAARQQILVNLLGLSVYERIREQATVMATNADAQLSATDRLLGDLSDATDSAISLARKRITAMESLASAVDAAVPALLASRQSATDARDTLAELDAELGRLSRVGIPAGVGAITGDASGAQEALAAAANAVTLAEEREEKVRGELAGAGDLAALSRLRDGYRERERLAAQAGEYESALATAASEHGRAVQAMESATGAAAKAAAAVDEAELAAEEARTHDRAATLRPHLREGEPCPVCTQKVATLPPLNPPPELAAANARLTSARLAVERATDQVSKRDRAARDLERSLVAIRTQHEQLAARIAELSERLAGAPSPNEVATALTAIAKLNTALEKAISEVRAARTEQRGAGATAQRAQERLGTAWRDFDSLRDVLARLGPPAVRRDDLAAAWQVLTGWAQSEVDSRRSRRSELSSAAAEAESAAADAARKVTALFADEGLAVPDPAAAASAAAVAVAQARNAHDRLVERRAQADQLVEQRSGYEREGQTARALATHLRANNFERWLLEEALDQLVTGASGILRELSGGQYDLVHDKGDFAVVDHYDAGLRRGVRTLSGGETFQASLALALALSDQMLGMSTSAASLESIILDEGFGTLDAATLDTVAATLENLAARGDRMVGVVTHVEALAERIPVRFEVRKDTRSAHVTRVGM